MLKPTYFDNKDDIITGYYRQLEDWILQDIANRLLQSETLSGSADYRLWKLQQMGLHRQEIEEKLIELTAMSDSEVRSMLEEAVVTSWKDDAEIFDKLGKTIANPLSSPRYMEVINAEYLKCRGALENLTRTTLNQSQTDLINLINQAEMQVATGTQSYSSAICEILDNYAKKGVTMVEYESGYSRSVESAVQVIMRTSMNQTSAQLTNQYIVENEVEYVLVSAHVGARHVKGHESNLRSHDWWQGKVFKVHGSEKGYPNLLESTGYDIQADGTGIVVNKLGLHGINCRHSHQAWDKDFGNPWIDEDGKPLIDREESIQAYENQQKQRAMERSIRQNKRQLLMKQTEIDNIEDSSLREQLQHDYDSLAYKLREKNQYYNDFCETNNLQKQADRIKVMNFNRAQARKANGRATIYNTKLQSKLKSGNINIGILQKPVDTQDVFYKGSFETLQKNGVVYNPIHPHSKQVTEQEIINALAGGDKTKGSCASVALAYCGQKAGYNVIDFRGGASQEFFAHGMNLMKLSETVGMKTIKETGASSLTVGNRLLKHVEEGKEYYLCVGKHASIVRKQNGKLQYLELQNNLNATYHPSGWLDFDGNPKFTLNSRFGCTNTSSMSAMMDFMIDINESNFDTDEFKSLLGFINTEVNEQKKGVGGFAK